MSAFGLYVFGGAGGGISSHPGAFIAVLFAKDKYISQMRGIYAELDLILMKKMVIIFTENVKIVCGNNAIHHFDTCGLSFFPPSNPLFR